jgi:hypothetical protein
MPTAEERIAEFAPNWLWGGLRCLATDWVVPYAVEQGDPANRNQLIAIQLETTAAAYRALAEGAQRAAAVVAGRSSG